MWRERGKQFMFVGKNKWESIRLLYSRQDTASFRPGQPHSRPTKRNLLEGDNVLIVETRLITNHYYTVYNSSRDKYCRQFKHSNCSEKENLQQLLMESWGSII